jgi:hypothetical protein
MDTTQTLDTKSVARSMRRFTLLVAGIGFALCSLLLTPIFIRYATDVAFQDSWWVYVLYCLTDAGLLELAVVVLCYPATLYAVWRLGFKAAAPVPGTFALLTLAKYVVNFLLPALTYEGTFPSAEEFWGFDLPIMLVNYGLEMLQFAMVILITLLVRRSFIRKTWMQQIRGSDGQGDMDLSEPDTGDLFTFSRVLGLRNHAQVSALLLAVVISIMRILMHQIYQFTLYFNGGTEGLLVMLTDLFLDLFIGVTAYFAALLLFARFRRKELEASVEED